MSMAGYRVAKRTDPDLSGSWRLWSDEQKPWIDVIYATEREAANMLAHLLVAERRRVPPGSGRH
jgi:hypothetical protein